MQFRWHATYHGETNRWHLGTIDSSIRSLHSDAEEQPGAIPPGAPWQRQRGGEGWVIPTYDVFGSFAELKGNAKKGAKGTFEQQFGVEKSPSCGLLQFKASSFLPNCVFFFGIIWDDTSLFSSLNGIRSSLVLVSARLLNIVCSCLFGQTQGSTKSHFTVYIEHFEQMTHDSNRNPSTMTLFQAGTEDWANHCELLIVNSG